MLLRLRSGRDPFWDDGQRARKTRTRKTLVSNLAFGLSILACGLTAAAWIRLVVPFVTGAPIG